MFYEQLLIISDYHLLVIICMIIMIILWWILIILISYIYMHTYFRITMMTIWYHLRRLRCAFRHIHFNKVCCINSGRSFRDGNTNLWVFNMAWTGMGCYNTWLNSRLCCNLTSTSNIIGVFFLFVFWCI